MNPKHKVIKTLLQEMCPQRAIDTIKEAQLPELEEAVLIECDVRRKSYVQVEMKYHISPCVIKKMKNSGYKHIIDAMNYKQEKEAATSKGDGFE